MWPYFFFLQITFQLILTTIFQLFALCKVGHIVLNVAVLVKVYFSSLVKQMVVVFFSDAVGLGVQLKRNYLFTH